VQRDVIAVSQQLHVPRPCDLVTQIASAAVSGLLPVAPARAVSKTPSVGAGPLCCPPCAVGCWNQCLYPRQVSCLLRKRSR